MINEHLFRSTRCLARELFRLLEKHDSKIVFAESCTAGLVSGVLAQVPGISNYLCGSAVTYRETAKQAWLGVDKQLIGAHTAVSREVTQKMAENVLQRTGEADFSVAVTGHLDPFACPEAPMIFIGLGYRQDNCIMTSQPVSQALHCRTRIDRQWESVRSCLNVAVEHLRFPPAENPDIVDWVKVCQDPINFHWNPWI